MSGGIVAQVIIFGETPLVVQTDIAALRWAAYLVWHDHLPAEDLE